MKLRTVLSATALCMFFIQVGCDNGEATGTKPENAKNTSGDPKDNTKTTADQEQGQGQGLLNKAGGLINKAKDSSVDGMNWIQDIVGDATDSGSEIAGDTAQWAQETFDSLKDQGLTSANNTGEWLAEDFNNMGAWQYTVLKVETDEPEQLEAKLNELGAARWECFHVATAATGEQVFYFKKPRRSYMRSLPLRDLLKLVPLMNGDE